MIHFDDLKIGEIYLAKYIDRDGCRHYYVSKCIKNDREMQNAFGFKYPPDELLIDDIAILSSHYKVLDTFTARELYKIKNYEIIAQLDHEFISFDVLTDTHPEYFI